MTPLFLNEALGPRTSNPSLWEPSLPLYSLCQSGLIQWYVEELRSIPALPLDWPPSPRWIRNAQTSSAWKLHFFPLFNSKQVNTPPKKAFFLTLLREQIKAEFLKASVDNLPQGDMGGRIPSEQIEASLLHGPKALRSRNWEECSTSASKDFSDRTSKFREPSGE